MSLRKINGCFIPRTWTWVGLHILPAVVGYSVAVDGGDNDMLYSTVLVVQ